MIDFLEFKDLTVAVDASGTEVLVDQSLRLPVELKGEDEVPRVGEFFVVIGYGKKGSEFRKLKVLDAAKSESTKLDPEKMDPKIIAALREAVMRKVSITLDLGSLPEASLAS